MPVGPDLAQLCRRRGGDRQRHVEVEGGTAPMVALDVDGAAHQFDQPAADGKPEARPAKAPRRRGVGLGEREEHAVHPRGQDADAGVADRDVQHHASGFVAQASLPQLGCSVAPVNAHENRTVAGFNGRQ